VSRGGGLSLTAGNSAAFAGLSGIPVGSPPTHVGTASITEEHPLIVTAAAHRARAAASRKQVEARSPTGNTDSH